MTKTAKICAAISSVAIIAAVIFGLITRNSYINYDPDSAVVYSSDVDVEKAVFSYISVENVLKEVEKQDFAFLITVKENEQIYEATKTTAVVEKVIKGNPSDLNKEIIIHEPNFMRDGVDYSTNEPAYFYYSMNYANNIMQPGKQYLVFVNKIPFVEAFEKTLEKSEYDVKTELPLYSFPVDTPVDYYLDRNETTYGKVKNYDYFCYTPEQRDILENTRKAVLEKYL